ncbi:MAG: hypothetical protein AB7V48_10115 [Sedimentibacter sp.]
MLRFKNMSIKGISFILALIVLSTGAPIASASSINDSFATKITTAEVSAVESAMEARGIGGDVKVETLYNQKGQPAFLLGVSNSGYQIITRETLMCIEGGEANPYAAYPDGVKYYGGILNYYVVSGNKYIDICRDVEVESIPESDSLNAAINSATNKNAAFAPSASATASITSTTIIPYASSRIQRKAFGYNNDNTCSAVACTIVLDYIDYNNSNIVPSSYHLENLVSKTGSDVATNSPKAHAFHRFLVDDCGMGAVSYANGISNAIDEYRYSSTAISGTEIDCEWTLNIFTNFGIDELEAGRPTMLTSTIAEENYDFHTMPVYGYRRTSDNSLEWLVHTGWYSTLILKDGVYRMPEVWVAASTATYLYRFTYNGM